MTTALELGATSFIDENMVTSTLVKELELLTLGEPVISVFILKRLLGHCSAPPAKTVAAPAVDELQPTNTQEQAEPGLRSPAGGCNPECLVQGAPNKVIAYQLKITEATVKVHVKAILRKIRVKNGTQAAIWAINRQTSMERPDAANGGSPLIPADLAYAVSDGSMRASETETDYERERIPRFVRR